MQKTRCRPHPTKPGSYSIKLHLFPAAKCLPVLFTLSFRRAGAALTTVVLVEHDIRPQHSQAELRNNVSLWLDPSFNVQEGNYLKPFVMFLVLSKHAKRGSSQWKDDQNLPVLALPRSWSCRRCSTAFQWSHPPWLCASGTPSESHNHEQPNRI